MTDNYVCCKCQSNNSVEEVTIQRCSHVICWKCLSDHVQLNLAPKIKCPVANCQRFLSDSAIRKVLSDEDTNKYEQLMLDKVPQRVKCLLPECPYVFIWDSTEGQFDCSECSLFNCLRCKAAHRFISCLQYGSIDEPDIYSQEEIKRAKKHLKARNKDRNCEMFKEMDDADIFVNDTFLDCSICCKTLAKGDGVILRCTHVFCRYCLKNHINTTFTIPIPCPEVGCTKELEEKEILELISEEELTTYINSCNSKVRGSLGFTFQCQSPNCVYFVEYSTRPDLIKCPLCKEDNCTKCVAIHTKETCAQFKERIKTTPEGIALLKIEERILRKELMRCLKCQQLLQKIAGCSWIQCSNCQFEMCWALQIRRWGPGGRGDTSDGCKCGVNGVRCTPNCGSCIPHNAPHNAPPNASHNAPHNISNPLDLDNFHSLLLRRHLQLLENRHVSNSLRPTSNLNYPSNPPNPQNTQAPSNNGCSIS